MLFIIVLKTYIDHGRPLHCVHTSTYNKILATTRPDVGILCFPFTVLEEYNLLAIYFSNVFTEVNIFLYSIY